MTDNSIAYCYLYQDVMKSRATFYSSIGDATYTE